MKKRLLHRDIWKKGSTLNGTTRPSDEVNFTSFSLLILSCSGNSTNIKISVAERTTRTEMGDRIVARRGFQRVLQFTGITASTQNAAPRRITIYDRFSKRQYLVDIDADVSVRSPGIAE